jgi:hypothetical protein
MPTVKASTVRVTLGSSSARTPSAMPIRPTIKASARFRARRLSISRSNPATTSVTPTTRLMATAAANRFRVSTTPTARVSAPRARTGFHGRSIGAEEGTPPGQGWTSEWAFRRRRRRGPSGRRSWRPGRPPGSPGEVENWAEHHGRSDQRGPISPCARPPRPPPHGSSRRASRAVHGRGCARC